uniref:Uncharacterized protein n=1 Tax=viral metagenome TaxID=1070528 RepID=A0A6C0K159_9ZZZZ
MVAEALGDEQVLEADLRASAVLLVIPEEPVVIADLFVAVDRIPRELRLLLVAADVLPLAPMEAHEETRGGKAGAEFEAKVVRKVLHLNMDRRGMCAGYLGTPDKGWVKDFNFLEQKRMQSRILVLYESSLLQRTR